MHIIQNDIYARVEIKNIDLLTKFIEAYDHLGIVSTYNRSEGIVLIRCTKDTAPDMIAILKNMPFNVEILKD